MSKFNVIVISIALSFSALLMAGCSTLGRTVKNYESDWSGGLERELTVYDATGGVLYQQRGKFDIQESDDGTKIIYDDENGLRHNIYLGSGTVVVNELSNK